jgi:HNH endonuclease
MPSSANYKRDYKQEYTNYHGSESQKDKRASRGRARYSLMKKGKVRLGDGLDVDHKDTNANNNSPSNLKVKSKSDNRSFKRNKNAGKA